MDSSWQEAFLHLKQALCSYPMLQTPLPVQPFLVYIDASDIVLGLSWLKRHPPPPPKGTNCVLSE